MTMVELSKERIEQILHEETAKNEELNTILRSLYTRYMHLYENYFADIDALDDDKIAELREYYEETKSLLKYYYMDIPQDICSQIEEFNKEYTDQLLGPGWHGYLFRNYDEFRENSEDVEKSEELFKAEFSEQILTYFYDEMSEIFRDGFNTGSKQAEETRGWLAGLLSGLGSDK